MSKTTAWKNIAIAGSVGAVILGSGAIAMAATGPHGSASNSAGPIAAATGGNGQGRLKGLLGHGLHGTWVTRDGKTSGAFVQHDAIRGQVTSVSATSITVKALDGVSMTFVVDAPTKVKVAGGTSIGDVHDNDQVAVAGTGTTTLTATHVIGAGARRAAAGGAVKS